MDVNSQYFDKEQIDSGQMQRFIQVLMDEAYDNGKYYNDIHIFPTDCEAFIVEWVQIPWDHFFGGMFKYVDEDEEVMIEREMPDGHYEYFHDDDEYEFELDQWLEENPGWNKNQYGKWVNETEEEKKWCID